MLTNHPLSKRILVIFFLTLLFNAAGCGSPAPMLTGLSSPAMSLLEDYFNDRTSLSEAEKYVNAELKQMRTLSSDGSFCRIPAFVWPDNTIVRVEPIAAKLGLRRGDRIIMVDGDLGKDWQGLLPMVVKHQPDEELNLTLVRGGVELERKVKCMDGRPLNEKWIAALDAASEGRWRECTVLSDELDRPPLGRFSGIALLRYHCSEAVRIMSHQIPTGTDAMLLYEARVRQIEEARYVPGGMKKIQGDVLNAIYWLKRNRFRPFATALTEELEKSSSP